MQPIIPPLKKNSQGTEIINLHFILFFLTQKLNDISINKFFNETGFQQAYKTEVFKQLYGNATGKLVSFFQEFFQIKQSEMAVVDKPTANKFNLLLREFNGLDMDTPDGYPYESHDDNGSNKPYTISGRIMTANNKPADKITVVAYNKNLRGETELGRNETTATGAFKILYEPVFPKTEYKTADLIFKLFDVKKEIKDFTLYEITNKGKSELIDGIRFNAGETIKVEIRLAEQTDLKKLSEFEEITLAIIPLLGEIKMAELNENESHKDFTFLSGETGLDKTKIIRFVLSHRMFSQSQIPTEFWYALTSAPFYQKLTETFTDDNLDNNLPRIIDALPAVSVTSVNEIIKLAFGSNLIDKNLEPRLNDWEKQFLAFIINRIINPEKEESEPYVKSLMNSSGLNKEKQQQFLSIYFEHRAFNNAFWKQVKEDKQLGENEINKLLFAHSLTQLTGNNEKLVDLVAFLPRITSMRELALKHNTESLANLITPDMLPEDVEGKSKKAKIKNYAGMLQQKLFETETSAVIQRMATEEELPIKDTHINKGIADFFNNQPDFNIRTTSIYNAIKNPDAFKGIPEKHKEEVIGHLKTIQRVQAISPTHESVAMMMKANISAAHQVTEMSQNSFLGAFSKTMGEDMALQVYTNATNVKIRNEHALIAMKESVQGTGIAMIDGNNTIEDRKIAFDVKAAEKSIPVSWENLFGSIDFCECGECNSVYSPAAYFVELLQYLRNNDLDPDQTGGQAIKSNRKDISGTALEKLFRRRPDLGCLELTCANTNTVLPYVDLVNEVMESFIVHLKEYEKNALNPKQDIIEPWNVEDETSGELLAQPQHINNDAYLELKRAVYPFTLPYDRPVDMIRIFLQYLETSRYELMEKFRAVAQNTISKDVMPEDTTLPASPSPDPDENKIPAFNEIVSDRAIDAEFLSITQEEYVILTKEAFLTKDYFDLRSPGITDGQYRSQIGVKQVPEYYGYTGKDSKSEMLSIDETLQTGLTFVKKQFLKRTGLLYVDLVELLKTSALNPMYPSGSPLMMLQNIPFSYRFLQGLVNKSSSDPKVRFKNVVDALENPQNYIPGLYYMDFSDPCKPRRRTENKFKSLKWEPWVLCYFERIGQMTVLDNGTTCDCVEGQFIRRDGTEIIQIRGGFKNSEGMLFLTTGCDLMLKLRGFEAKVGHVDSMTGQVTLTDVNGKPIDIAVLTDQQVIFKGANGEIGVITQERLINQRTELPFTCSDTQTDTCDLSRVRLKHLDGSALTVWEYDKIHRFIRLWRKLGWTIDETDKSLVALTADKTTYTRGIDNTCDPEVDPKGFAEITPDFIHQLVALKKLENRTGLELIKLLTFWTDISTAGEKSLYQKLFLRHNLLTLDDVFRANDNGNYLTVPNKISDHIPVLMAALKMKAEEIDSITSFSDPLTLQSVSKLYRYSLLAKILQVKAANLSDIFVLFGDPFQNADRALEFFDKWSRLEDAGFTFSQLNYIIQDKDDLLTPIKPSKNILIQLAKTLYDGLTGIDNTNPDLPVIDELTIKMLIGLTANARKVLLKKIATEELVRTKVSLLFDQKSAESIIGLLQGTNAYNTTAPAGLVKSVDEFIQKFPTTTPTQKTESELLLKKIKYDFNTGGLQVTGILTTKELAFCKNLFTASPGWKTAFDDINSQALYIFNDLLTDVFNNDIASAIKVILDGDINNPDDPASNTASTKREYFLESFLPFLREKLTGKFLVETLSVAAGLEGDTTDVLISDILEDVSSKKIKEIFKDIKLPPAPGTKGWQGYLIPTTDENYTFSVKTSSTLFSLTKDGENILDSTIVPIDDFYVSTPVKLKAGQFYFIEVTGLTADLNEINWKTPAAPKSPIPHAALLPLTALLLLEEGFIRLLKASIIVNGFALNADEIVWLQDHPGDFDGLDFNALLLVHLLRIDAYTRLKNSLPASDMLLIDFFKWTHTTPASTVPSDQIALLFQRKKEEIEVLIAQAHFNLMTPTDFSSEINLLRLQETLYVYDKINLKLDMLFEWAAPVSQFKVCQNIAETIQKAIQARYNQDDWEQVVKPLNDRLREDQKQGLINYLLVQPELIKWGVVDADSLFEFFLIDVQMDACMQTSRLKQAISSVQLFVQRCFLGLEAERGVPNKLLDRVRWNWMQRNPLWVANRKVFLYPENWIVSNLRDDKSQFFKELESELLQKDINKQNVTDALKIYLYKLDGVANMEVIGIYIEMADGININGKATRILLKLHVFARTRNAPYLFYYRYFDVKEGNWYAWEKLQVDIPTYDVGKVPLTILISNATFSSIPGNPQAYFVNFDGTIQGYPASTSNFSSRFVVGSGVSIKQFETDVSNDIDSVVKGVQFNIGILNGVAIGSIDNIHTAGSIFSGYFNGELIRKDNTNGCFLIPAVWNGRLLIFFPQITRKTNPDPFNPEKTMQFMEIKMAWSEYRNGKWTQKQVGKDPLNTHPLDTLKQIEYFKFVPIVTNNCIFIDVDDNLDSDGGYLGAFTFDGNNVFLGGGDSTGNIPINYFNKIELSDQEIGSKIYSWQISNKQRANTSVYFENVASKEMLRGVAPTSNFFHPYAHDLLGSMNLGQLDAFYNYNLSIADKADAFGANGVKNYHELKRPYSLYNWELFFHTPIAIAEKLSTSNQFEEAMKWYHYVFDPTAKGVDTARFWQFAPFKEINTNDILETLFNGLQPNTPDKQINDWRNKPFQPHLVARDRPSAYMKWVVMGYIDNLIAWGDYLFTQDTIETVNYATQLYILAGHILGPRPQMIPKRGKIKPQTYNSLLDKWDAFGNAMVELELMAPFSNQISIPVGKAGGNGEVQTANVFGFASSLYFCIPNNPKLMGYWDTIADRLFKIRHCENIEGVFRMLPLWDPPIDPALLVAATAQGLSLDSVLNDLNTPLPNFRFNYLIQKAIELCNEVKSLGNSLLMVLEKKDGEVLAKMRAGHETAMNNLVMEVKKLQLDEANKALEGLRHNRITPAYRLRHYLQLVGEDLNKVPSEDKDFSELANQLEKPFDESGLKLIAFEKEEMDKSGLASERQGDAATVQVFANIAHAVPNFNIKWPTDGTLFGGSNVGSALNAWSGSISDIARRYTFEAGQSSKLASFKRQLQDRILQANIAGYEIKQIDKQILSQKIRISISEQEITNQQKMIDNASEVEDFLKNKYTNEELYDWMKGSIKTIYHQVYKLAYNLAKKAEQVYRFERGLTHSNFIQYGYWDEGYDGLQAGERLYLGLKQLESAHQENKGYDFEVNKHISLQQLDPIALIELRETGKCEFVLPEVLFDMDFPGHYMRRIKSVALSIPCIAGPYTSINSTLRLLEHKFRVSSIANNNKDYPQKTDDIDERFTSVNIPIASIATSTGQNDSGVFELNFKDERYMPFEGAGAISQLRLELPDTFRQFNYETISDVIVHLRYTSVDGGDKLKKPASDALKDYLKNVKELSKREGLFAMFDLKNDFPNEWHQALVLPLGAGGRVMDLGNLSGRLPFYTKNFNMANIKVTDIYFAMDAIKITDLTLMHKNTPLPGSFEGPEKINKTSLYHLGDLDKTIADNWSLKFADKITVPSRMLMVMRFVLS